jgi:chemotaxis protein methyltransferase CheR
MSEVASATPTISAAEFEKFREFFYRKTGIQFDVAKRYFVDKRLVERMHATGSTTFREYFMLLRFELSGEEVQSLTNLMTVNETYFFREEYQFRCLTHSILPDVVHRKADKRPIRIWVIPSSTGEEAYSIALSILEFWPGLADWDIEIISSDIDTDVLDRARAGLYSDRSVQQVPPALYRKYFKRECGDHRLSEDVRSAVQVTRVNLNDRRDTIGYREFDVIFCRNLLIYFDDVSRKEAAETFYDALTPGGFICLGHSESMSRVSSLFKVRKFPEAIVYQKPVEAA